MSEHAFLISAGWSEATKTPLAGDASSRRYTRLSTPNGSAILMDEGPNSSAQLTRFADIAKHLTNIGLSAPKILAENSDQFLLIEDLGDAVFARVIAQNPSMEAPLYKAAIDALIVSQRAPSPTFVSTYGPSEMTDAIALLFEWYPTPETTYNAGQVREVQNMFCDLLTTHTTGDPVLLQRDFHAENLIWIPDRSGPARVGLLDFQDAVSGNHAYDIASLLVDARRDVSSDTKLAIVEYYIDQTGANADAFNTAFALCSAQRNLRILGIFARLAIRDAKPAYIDLIPRVWHNLKTDLKHPLLQGLREKLDALLPAPTTEILSKIRTTHV